MIRYTRKSALPAHMCDVAKALDDAWDGAYEIDMAKRHIIVRNPGTGKEAFVRYIPGTRSPESLIPVLLSAPAAEGAVPEFDWDATGNGGATPLMRAARLCVRAHEAELRFGETYETVALSEGEQALLDEGLAEHMREEQQGFLLAGSVPEELVLVPAAKGWIAAVIEFSLGHPATVDGFTAYAMLESRLPYLRGRLADLGIPGDAIEAGAPRTDKATGKPVVDVRLRKTALDAAGARTERIGDRETLRVSDNMLCSLTPRRDFYELRVLDKGHGTARVPVVTRMRADTRLARLQGGKALRDTKGAIRLDAAIG